MFSAASTGQLKVRVPILRILHPQMKAPTSALPYACAGTTAC